jgi:hypothetical protein
MDFFTPVVDAQAQHPNFRTITQVANGFDGDVLMDWARGFEDRDGKFVKEFQTTFNSSFWELYIFAVLKSRGLTVDFSYASPDFVIPGQGGLNIEATVALHAQDGIPEHMRANLMIPDDLNELNRDAILRLSNSISIKRRKFEEFYSRLSHVRGRPFALAVAAFDRPHALACQRAIEALLHGYYVDEEAFLREGGTLTGKQRHSVTKDNGTDIPLGLFSDESHAWLSAVIFSSCATWGKVAALSADPNPNRLFFATRYNASGVASHVIKANKSAYQESLLDGLRVYHNPFAFHPLEPSIFRHRDVFQSYYADDERGWVYECRDGVLLHRFTLTIRTAAPSQHS